MMPDAVGVFPAESHFSHVSCVTRLIRRATGAAPRRDLLAAGYRDGHIALFSYPALQPLCEGKVFDAHSSALGRRLGGPVSFPWHANGAGIGAVGAESDQAALEALAAAEETSEAAAAKASESTLDKAKRENEKSKAKAAGEGSDDPTTLRGAIRHGKALARGRGCAQVAFSADGAYLLSLGGEDRIMMQWRLRDDFRYYEARQLATLEKLDELEDHLGMRLRQPEGKIGSFADLARAHVFGKGGQGFSTEER